MCDSLDGEPRQASAEIEVTPEMIEAGKKALIAMIGDDRWIENDDQVVTEIFCAMFEKVQCV